MCGRFVVNVSREELTERFNAVVEVIQLPSSYNVAPGSFIPTIVQKSPNKVVLMKWGLIPHWSREFKVKFSTINARSENLKTSPVYKTPYQKQRCLIPANGFYEWKRIDATVKKPYFIRVTDQKIFSFAGLYDIWKDAEGKEFHTCTIVTTTPNSVVERVHNRMPVILKKDDENTWLNQTSDQKTLDTLLVPYPAKQTEAYPVSVRVNSPKNDDAGLMNKEPVV